MPKKVDKSVQKSGFSRKQLALLKAFIKEPWRSRLSELGDKKTDERARIEEEIKKKDNEVDNLVYKIYGITDEEKKIIEESLE